MEKLKQNPIVKKLGLNRILLACILVLMFVVFKVVLGSKFPVGDSIKSTLNYVYFLGFLSLGVTFVIATGGIDFSIGPVMFCCALISGYCMTSYHVPCAAAMVICILIGFAFGVFNGWMVSYMSVPPFIISMASMNIAKGIALVITGGAPIRCMEPLFKWPGAGYIGPFPVPAVLMIIIFIIAVFMVNRTQLGRHIYAVGGNAQAAKFSGINVEKVKFIVYTYTGIMAGIAGVIIASRLYSGQPTAGDGAEMDAIAAVVVGGTSMSGGSGTLGGTLIGVLIIGILNNGLNLMGVDSNWQYIVKGLVILLAVYVDWVRNKKAGS